MSEEYGKDIFYGESKTKIARKGTNLRNKINHISKQKNVMQGELVHKAIIDKQYDIIQLNVTLFKYTNEILGV